jgi:hypothetical protein
MRPPDDHIYAPPLSPSLKWINAGRIGAAQQRGAPMLIEFWDFCRPNSIRTLPYVKSWHQRYAERGLRVLGIHSPGFAPSRDPEAVREAVARLGIRHPVAIDSELAVWRQFGNRGWPARYLFDAGGRLVDYHYGEGAYLETEEAICRLLGCEFVPQEPLRPEEAPGALLEPPTPEVQGPYSGPYRAGGVWAVLEGRGSILVNDRRVSVSHPGAYELIRHERSTAGRLRLQIGAGVVCHATCFTPGLDRRAG